MSEDQSTEPASAVPPAAPLTDEPAEPNQPDPSEVLPIGDATETEMVVPDEEQQGSGR